MGTWFPDDASRPSIAEGLFPSKSFRPGKIQIVEPGLFTMLEERTEVVPEPLGKHGFTPFVDVGLRERQRTARQQPQNRALSAHPDFF